MKKVIDAIENFEISPIQWVCYAFAIIGFRMVLESFSANGLEIYAFPSVFLQPPLLFLTNGLSIVLLLHFFTKTPVKKLLNLMLVGLVFIFTTPIVDFIVSQGRGNVRSQYLFSSFPELIQRYFTYFGAGTTTGITYGFRTQVTIFIIGTGLYLYIRTKKAWKVALGVFLAYTIFFLYTALPALVGALSYLPSNPWLVSEIQIAQRFFAAKNIFAISYPPEKVQGLFSIEMSLILLPLFVIQFFTALFLMQKSKFFEFLKRMRYLRLAFHIGAFAFGLFLAKIVFKTPFDLSLYGVLMLFSLVTAIVALWIYSMTINDQNDVAIDVISNQNRLIPKKIFTVEEFKYINFLALFFAALGTLIAGYPFFMLAFACVTLSILYSTPPFRLRNFPIVAPGIMAFGTLLIVMLGFALFATSGTLNEFPINFFVLILAVTTLVMNLKDIKDVAGDKPNGIMTIPTIFGLEKSKTIIAVLFFISYLLFPIILNAPQLYPTAIVFGLLTGVLIKSKKVREGVIFAIYSLFLLVALLLVF